MAEFINNPPIRLPKSRFIRKLKNVSENFQKVVEILRLEANAIEQAANNLNAEAVEKAIDLLAKCDSKVIVSGVGKSGVIAQKIAQTLISTGTLAVFLHPSDALHGSLGVIANGDVVIALSNSGETDELLVLLPAIKQRGASLIAIVGNHQSTLARNAEVVLDAWVNQEACPLNLAPTASTTVALAIGDALAMTLMEIKNITAEDFAANHPAGRLGKRLTLRVADLMHGADENPKISANSSWLEVVSSISRYGLGAVNVVDFEENLTGLVTDGDLRRAIEKTAPENLLNLHAEQMMTANPTVATPEMPAFDALQLMENRPKQISVLPVVNQTGKSVGLLRLHDIVRSGL